MTQKIVQSVAYMLNDKGLDIHDNNCTLHNNEHVRNYGT